MQSLMAGVKIEAIRVSSSPVVIKKSSELTLSLTPSKHSRGWLTVSADNVVFMGGSNNLRLKFSKGLVMWVGVFLQLFSVYSSHHLFIQQTFIECLLHAKLCSGCQGHSSEQDTVPALAELLLLCRRPTKQGQVNPDGNKCYQVNKKDETHECEKCDFWH